MAHFILFLNLFIYFNRSTDDALVSGAQCRDWTSLHDMLCSQVYPPAVTMRHYYSVADYIPCAVPFISVTSEWYILNG